MIAESKNEITHFHWTIETMSGRQLGFSSGVKKSMTVLEKSPYFHERAFPPNQKFMPKKENSSVCYQDFIRFRENLKVRCLCE